MLTSFFNPFLSNLKSQAWVHYVELPLKCFQSKENCLNQLICQTTCYSADVRSQVNWRRARASNYVILLVDCQPVELGVIVQWIGICYKAQNNLFCIPFQGYHLFMSIETHHKTRVFSSGLFIGTFNRLIPYWSA